MGQGGHYRDAGDWARAAETYRRATEADATNLEAWAELGCLLADARRFEESVDCLRRVWGNRNVIAAGVERETAALLSGLAAGRPDWGPAQFSLGCAYEGLGDYQRARTHLANAMRLDPFRKAAIEALSARMFWLEGKQAEALEAADRALAVNPDYYLALLIRGKACSAMGRMPEAVTSLGRSVEIVPNQIIHSGLLFQMNYLADTTPEALYAEAARWNSLYAAPLATRIQPHTNTPDPERRLKVGYVSPDLYQHTVMKFAPPVFEHHDRSRLEVFVYAVGPNSDHISDAVRGMVENYASIRGPYGELAERVRADGIDILVDLAGHTMGPALLAFALKPAPVQVSWMGYAGTTGMPAMDYFLGDPHMPCPGTESFFSEKVYRLPRVECCYRPIGQTPIAEAPCLERGYITFGCFNNPRKITRQAAMLWSAVLHLVKESRLLLKFHGLDAETWQMALRGWFQEDGIAPERILFEGPSSPGEYLAVYNRIDIALDPFPYNGSSTTLDAIWMGVPVVTLAGRLAVERCGASILAGAGLPGLVTATPEQYLKLALFLADRVAKEPELRVSIRNALIASPWMDEVTLVREVETAYRDMWHAWCRAKS